MHDATAPFAGLLVLDLLHLLDGPYASMTLRDMDAEVIKVAQTDGGDDSSQWVILTWRRPKRMGLQLKLMVAP
jgi:crotonobetainyl-CoA:carnitine CoA-transferase CaiB-like acyl-CoA transferase